MKPTTPHTHPRRSARLVACLASVAGLALLLTACTDAPDAPDAQPGDLHQVDGETAHLQCQGAGPPTLLLLGGMGFTTTTWLELRDSLGPEVRTCAWDYPGIGHSTGEPMMTADQA